MTFRSLRSSLAKKLQRKGNPKQATAKSISKEQTAKPFIESKVQSHQIVVFAKSWCQYCDRTKTLLGLPLFQNVDVQLYDLDLMKGGSDVQQELACLTGQRAVPSVWVNGKFLGGNDDFQHAYRTGQWAALLQQ
jgi:glutaredoxin 3